jgi:chromosome partitioning protein
VGNELKIVSVINYKGGVGKTTVTANIGTYLASKDKHVLMIDLDPQTNLTLSFMNNEEWVKQYASNKTLKNFFQPILEGDSTTIPLESLIIPLEVKRIKLDIISSHLELIDVDTQLAAGLGAGTDRLLLRNFLTVNNHIRKGIETLSKKYDIILLDCPPSFNSIVKNALTASDFYLVPAKMDYLSTFGINQLWRNLKAYIEKYNESVESFPASFVKISPKMLGVVPTMLKLMDEKPIQSNLIYLNQVKSKGYYIFPGLRENANIYAPAPNNGIPVFLANNSSSALRGIIMEIENLSKDFIAKTGI